jgi:hypothetical protein
MCVERAHAAAKPLAEPTERCLAPERKGPGSLETMRIAQRRDGIGV